MNSPRLSGRGVEGSRCTSCGYAAAPPCPRCPACGGPSETSFFPASGTVWASTLLHIGVGDRTPPFAFAYVDLDGGPRVLAPLDAPAVLDPGTRVALTTAPPERQDDWCVAQPEEEA